ncbi:cell division protein ZapE [Klebsiella sp. I138]|uniref:cell division protein ZapE n=1 Tax=Klebsiella sp. I138 TaxID=2755385 RepID=UPI003DA96355
MTQGIIALSFSAFMTQRARERALTLDTDQQTLVSHLDTLSRELMSGTSGGGKGLYIWGRTGRGKSFVVDHFFASLPLAAKRRVHFHAFFRELHQRLNTPAAPTLPDAIAQMTGDCRVLCFDEFHLHDPGDAMLVKVLLAQLFQRGVVLITTSNYPPDQLLANPLHHERFAPSIALIKQHMKIAALDGEEDYRARHAPMENPFCRGWFLVQPSARIRQALALPDPATTELPLQVGYRTLHVASAPGEFLHFTFARLCGGATAVMDYLTLCDTHTQWVIDAVPPLCKTGPAAQQRFINLVDVLYEKQCCPVVVADCGLADLVADVERDDIQRTYSRLLQLRQK